MKKRIKLSIICVVIFNYNLLSQVISSFSPTSAAIGANVTISGSGFLSGGTNVWLNDNTGSYIVATVVSATSNQVVFVVPNGTTCNKVCVKINGNPSVISSTNYFKRTLPNYSDTYFKCFGTPLNFILGTSTLWSGTQRSWNRLNNNTNITGQTSSQQTSAIINDIINPVSGYTLSTTATYSIIQSYTAGTCPSSISYFTVSLRQKPIINIASTNSLLCTGQSCTISANGANTYTWNTGSNTQSIVVSPTTTTSYTLSGSQTYNDVWMSQPINTTCTNSAIYAQSVSICTNLEENFNSQNTYSVFPNPFKDKLNITSDVNIKKIEIYNLVGNLIYISKEGTSVVEIDMTPFSSGVYFIKMGLVVNKIIKQ